MLHSDLNASTKAKFIFDITDEIDFATFSGDVDFKINRKEGSEGALKDEEIVLEKRQLQK